MAGSSHYMLIQVGGHRSTATRIFFAKLDPEDYGWAKQHHWTTHSKDDRRVYAKRAQPGPDRSQPFLHRELLGLPPGKYPEVDHKNGDKLDNRRANLRIVTTGQNNQNLQGALRNSQSGIRGVCLCKQTGRWRAEAQLDGKAHWLGRHATIEEAEAAVVAFRRWHMPFSEMDH